MTAVILYHAGIRWIPGGLLGVDCFFVISGFLITTLLLTEHSRRGRISLRDFWMRRVRRLMPALVLILLFIVVCWGLLLDDDVLSLRRDVLFALGYSANWWFAFSGQGYFQAFAAPSPVLHMWSLAVEEQFYLLWPLVVVGLLARGRRVARWAAGGALLAAVACLSQSLAGVWTDRLYYGTDTRAVPLLVGAALGGWYTGRGANWHPPIVARVALQLAGLIAAVGLGWAVANVDGRSIGLYRGGFLAIAVGAGLVIASITFVPAGPLSRLLSLPLARYVGTISYGLYLWHWPLFLLITHQRVSVSGGGLLAIRLALTFTAASLSHLFIELPIRQRRWRLRWPQVTAPVAVVAVVAALAAATPPHSPGGGQLTSVRSAVPKPNAVVGSKASRIAGQGTARVLVVGDSLAFTLAWALSYNEKPYGVHLDIAALLGCGIARGNPVRVSGAVTMLPEYCDSWPQRQAKAVAADKPDVVALLVGRWEVFDRVHNGRWEHIGEPEYDTYLAGELDRATSVLSATGARVALLTAPCTNPREGPDGTPFVENDPARRARFNQLIVQAHERHPAITAVVDLDSMICPGGQFAAQLDGVTIRTPDGIHFPQAAMPPVAQKLLPVLRALAVPVRAARGAVTTGR